MKLSNLLGQTLREAPADAEVASHILLLRAGYIRQLGSGLYSMLHLGQRVTQRIEAILRDEMDAIGGQEISMPVVHPADLWKETGRWYAIGSEMGRFKDKNDHDMVLAVTHEEIVTDLARKDVRSYKQLPRMVYHIQTKWRDDPRPRAGLLRVREFRMKDAYSLDIDQAGLDAQYDRMHQAYLRMFARCGLNVIAVDADVGMMGGTGATEYMYLTPVGEDTLILCDACGYAANRQIATFAKPAATAREAQPLHEIATPEMTTIDALAAFLEVSTAETAKAVFFIATVDTAAGQSTERFVFAVVRGDLAVNETKLANAVGARALRPARTDEITAIGATPGYASPISVSAQALIVCDDSVASSPNLVAGANKPGYHLLNVNLGRDFQAHIISDIAAAEAGCACPRCGAALRAERGVEVGNIFKLGTHYSTKLEATYLDKDGKQRPIVMGSYGIGVGRLMACIAEQHHDDRGLIWPAAIAPFHVHLVGLKGAESEAEQLYHDLRAAGVSVLFDDRNETPGVKFADADLIGIPVRLTIGKRSLENGGVEVSTRRSGEKHMLAVADVVSRFSTQKI
jgi:prolyl-tRNA synthetase